MRKAGKDDRYNDENEVESKTGKETYTRIHTNKSVIHWLKLLCSSLLQNSYVIRQCSGAARQPVLRAVELMCKAENSID